MIPSLSISAMPKQMATSIPSSENDRNAIRSRRRQRSLHLRSRTMPGSSTSLMMLFLFLACSLFSNTVTPVHSLSTAKNEWISKSLKYYNRVTRGAEHVQQSPTYLKSAMENYFALEKLRDNKPHHAELIYRRLMDDFNPVKNGHAEMCDFSNLAVPTLLLGLLLQREERYDDARTVFDGFSHVLDEAGPDHKCCCAARVLQAHALFEMKQDNPVRAAELIIRAVRMDHNLRPVLRWKLFRQAVVEYKAANRARFQQGIGFATP